MAKEAVLGVFGGSGLYDMPGLTDVVTKSVHTPWGLPSDDVVIGTLEGVRTAFVPRHGRGHRYLPTEVNYRANAAALKLLGCEFVLAVSAVGSMKEEIAPGNLVTVDQFIDRTTARVKTFFGDGVVGHVPFSDPTCDVFRPIVAAAAKDAGAAVHEGGTYLCIEGPQFSTRAESLLYRSWGVSVIGMTAMPEAKLVREAGMSYALLALATDYDCWHESEEAVSVEAVVAALKKNVTTAQAVVRGVAKSLGAAGAPKVSPFANVLEGAVMTSPNALSVDAQRRLRAIGG